MSVFITVKLLIEIVEGLDLARLHIDISFDLLLAVVGLIPRLVTSAKVEKFVVILFVFVLVVANLRLMGVRLKTLRAFLVQLLQIDRLF